MCDAEALKGMQKRAEAALVPKGSEGADGRLRWYSRTLRTNERRYVWSLVAAVAGLGLLGLILGQANLGESWRLLTQLDGRLIPLPLLITVGCVLLRPWRWRAIFPSAIRPGFWSCFAVFAIGNMTNNLLPGRGGDLLRCFLVSREHPKTPASSALATLGLEKVLDGLVLVAVVLASSLLSPSPPWFGRLQFFSGIFFGVALVTLLVFRHRFSWFLGPTRSLLRALHLMFVEEKLASLAGSFAEGLKALSSPWQMAGLLLFTTMIWAGESGLVWGLALALRVPLSLAGAVIVSAILGLGLSVPAAPGFLGTYEFFSVAALTLLGVNLEAALALAVVMHAWSFAATMMCGLIGFGVSGMKLSDLVRGSGRWQVLLSL